MLWRHGFRDEANISGTYICYPGFKGEVICQSIRSVLPISFAFRFISCTLSLQQSTIPSLSFSDSRYKTIGVAWLIRSSPFVPSANVRRINDIVFCTAPLLQTREYIDSVATTFNVDLDSTYRRTHISSEKNCTIWYRQGRPLAPPTSRHPLWNTLVISCAWTGPVTEYRCSDMERGRFSCLLLASIYPPYLSYIESGVSASSFLREQRGNVIGWSAWWRRGSRWRFRIKTGGDCSCWHGN